MPPVAIIFLFSHSFFCHWERGEGSFILLGQIIWVMWGSYDVGYMHCILYRCSRLNESETKDTKQKVLKVSNWNRTDLVEKIMFKDQTIEIWAYSKSKESRRIVLAPVISLRNLRESDSIAISNVTNVYSS